jgi:organic radical activating enzyme
MLKETVDNISASFCSAKWLQLTLDLTRGLNHSCHHPERHEIPLAELEKNSAALHNTEFKKLQRKKMLAGTRPEECSYCWKIEDSNTERFSDRYIKSLDVWSLPYLEQIQTLNGNEDIAPTYLEVMLDSVCQFQCSYCIADISSSIEAEMNQFGPYNVSNQHRMARKNKLSKDPEQNPYIKAFWDWFPKISKDLHVFRLTGGEPLLSSQTKKIIEYFEQHSFPQMTLALNTNLGIKKEIISDYAKKIRLLIDTKKIKDFEVYTSLDTFGNQAEYIRKGLNFKTFEENLKYVLEFFPDQKIIIMCTFNLLSIPKFHLFLDWVADLKKDYPHLQLDVSYLKNPEYLSAMLLTKDLLYKVEEDYRRMINLNTFKPHEINKFARVKDWLSLNFNSEEVKRYRIDFVNFINEYDKRTKQNLLKTFPELKEFYQIGLNLITFNQLDF